MTTTKKTASFPRRAYWLRECPVNGYGDFVTVHAVNVLRLDGPGMAVIELREGKRVSLRCANVIDLASTPEKALEKISVQLTALASRPLHHEVAGMTEAGAVTQGENKPPTQNTKCPRKNAPLQSRRNLKPNASRSSLSRGA